MAETADNLLLEINELRSRREGFLTNAMFTRPAVEKLLSSNPTVHRGEGLVCILEDDGGVHRIHYFAASPESLRGLEELPFPSVAVADLVKKAENSSLSIDVLLSCDFEPYSTFVRLSRPGVDGCWKSDGLLLADKCDVGEIYGMVFSTFDPLTAHMPTEMEISDAIEAEDVLVCRSDDGKIAGFAWLETISARSSCLRYLITVPSQRGKGTGSLLVESGLKKAGPQSHVHLSG